MDIIVKDFLEAHKAHMETFKVLKNRFESLYKRKMVYFGEHDGLTEIKLNEIVNITVNNGKVHAFYKLTKKRMGYYELPLEWLEVDFNKACELITKEADDVVRRKQNEINEVEYKTFLRLKEKFNDKFLVKDVESRIKNGKERYRAIGK